MKGVGLRRQRVGLVHTNLLERQKFVIVRADYCVVGWDPTHNAKADSPCGWGRAWQ